MMTMQVALWVIIALLLVVLFNLFQPGSGRNATGQIAYSDFIGEVKDEYGITIQNIRDKYDIKLSDDTAAQLARRPVQFYNGFTLLPGRLIGHWLWTSLA